MLIRFIQILEQVIVLFLFIHPAPVEPGLLSVDQQTLVCCGCSLPRFGRDSVRCVQRQIGPSRGRILHQPHSPMPPGQSLLACPPAPLPAMRQDDLNRRVAAKEHREPRHVGSNGLSMCFLRSLAAKSGALYPLYGFLARLTAWVYATPGPTGPATILYLFRMTGGVFSPRRKDAKFGNA